MNPAKTKLLTWTVAGALGVALCLYVVVNLKRIKAVQAPVSTERMTQVLSDTPAIVEKADDIIAYDRVQSALINFDWPGEPPPAIVEERPVVIEPKRTELEVAKLVQILGYKVDASLPENGQAILKYLPASKVPAPTRGNPNQIGLLKRPGDRLDDPIAHIRIVSIGVAGVEFGFDDEEREHELLGPLDYDLEDLIVHVDGDNIVTRKPEATIPKGGWTRNPKETQFIGRDRFRIGTEDLRNIGENYPQILSEDVRLSRHKDPKTGRYDGIQIQSVAPNSVAARHGAETGDVIKSINGHAVTSTQEAINFVKNNTEMYERWDVVVVNKGRERTVTYYPPAE